MLMSSRLPVTLIGGFLGAGKTSLLHHLITEHEGGYLAVLVENPGPLNLDAKALKGLCGAMRRSHDTVLEIPDGDAPSQISAIANCLRDLSAAGRYERVLIELAGTSGPAWLTPEFLDGGAFAPWAELSQVICVVGALEQWRTMQGPASMKPMEQFFHEQAAGATMIVLNKCDLIEERQVAECTKELRRVIPGARIIETAYGEMPSELLLAPARPAEITAALDRRAKMPPGDLGSVASALYRVHRPFHPQRFWDWFNENHVGLLRAKGLIWLATRNLLVGGVSRTLWQNGCGVAGIWWAALPREEWPEDDESLARMQETWREPYGDRRQDLVLIGDADFLSGAARRQLDACLLTDEEYARPVGEWAKFTDPFPEWDLEEG